MKETVLFESKEYGIGGHNKLELRILDDGELRLWIRDGECNSLICMDRADFERFATVVSKHADTAPVEVEVFDFRKSVQRGGRTDQKVLRRKKKLKTRSKKQKLVGEGMNPDNYKADKIQEALK